MNSRYRERKYNTSDNDRLIRALSQPVQAWEKKWTPQSNSKTLQTFKWVKSDKVIEFEQDEESDEEPEPMETDQTPVATTTTVVEQVETVKTEGTTSEATGTSVSETIAVKDTADGQERVSTTNITSTGQPSNTSTDTAAATATTTAHIATTSTSNTASEKKLDESSIPGGPSSIISNKAVSSIAAEDAEDDDDQRSQTPKLDDISDDEEKNRDDDGEDNDVDSINDASKHPALAPHAQAHMTDDDMTDSTVATPQTTTEGNTPMPMLEDEPMEESATNTLPHPLSQEILTGTTAFINNEDNGSMNNDSPAIQTPEDHVPQPEAMEEQ
ncbi:hypothetical protein HMPREF1544_09664 [Mucor circinelloides 1006PhL]|uniref:Uncharacterized protein n=1 Tax=Mucor circinelloides f. circinelloides (strain 1006PhL) TaxID=1220926 RepID=S2J5R9_MUCC1|nr:hypothetical protein HMPREF1544_09664 [Mucor circinelloides 1006PhL]